MTPGSFDPATAREVIGDGFSRTIEAKARADADAGIFDPPSAEGATYWDAAQKHMQASIYCEQHAKRMARNERKRSGVTT